MLGRTDAEANGKSKCRKGAGSRHSGEVGNWERQTLGDVRAGHSEGRRGKHVSCRKYLSVPGTHASGAG